jgi:adenine-specific DNA-methyltransferase
MRFFSQSESLNTPRTYTTLASYGGFIRGIATGANEYFTFSLSEALSSKIPEIAYLNCITKSAQIRKSTFSNDDMQWLRDSGAKCLILNPTPENKHLITGYLDSGIKKGYNLRYLTSKRQPWYKLEHRSPAPILLGVFSRDGYKVVRNYSTALNLTCYHGFIPNLFGDAYIDHLFLYLMSKTARQLLVPNTRHYGDRLDKFEPNDINSAPVPSTEIFDQIPTDMIYDAMKNCRENNVLPRYMEDVFHESIIK